MPRKTTRNAPLSPLVVVLIPSWLRSLRAANLTPRTLRTRSGDLHRFCAWLSDSGESSECTTTIAEVSQEMCQCWVTHILDTKSANTARTYYMSLKVFLDWCVLEGEIVDKNGNPAPSPMAHMKPPKAPEQLVPILTDKEVSQLLRAVSGKTFRDRRDNAIIRLFLSTGMRLQELAGLELDDLDLETNTVRIRHAKGGEDRVAAFGPITAKALDAYLRVRHTSQYARLPAVWLTSWGAMAYLSFDGMLQGRANQAGIATAHAHLFRHRFAHSYLDAGGGEVNLTALAGWKSTDMVKRRYGKALLQERAIREQHRLNIGEEP